MRLFMALVAFSAAAAVLASTGCSPDTRLQAQQRQYQETVNSLQSDLQERREENSDLQSELIEKDRLVQRMREESVIQGEKFQEVLTKYENLVKDADQAGPLPEELNAVLAAFAEVNSDLLTYDPLKGRVRLKSDVSFNPGSDVVKDQAKSALAALAQICSTDQAKDCKVLIVGHTDDLPIVRPQTIEKHPTNWHLSVHRAIAVMDVLKESMPEGRLAVMGLGEWDPVAPNLPNRRGNPLNRRVEIFIVPKQSLVPAATVR